MWLLLILFIFIIVIVVAIKPNNKPPVQNATKEGLKQYDDLNPKYEYRGSQIKQQFEDYLLKCETDYADYDSIEFTLAGLFYRSEKAKDEAASLCKGEEVKLRKNSTNEADSTAVKVIYDNLHIGFVPSDISDLVTDFINTHKNIVSVVLSNEEVYNSRFDDTEHEIVIKTWGVISKPIQQTKVAENRYDYYKNHAAEIELNRTTNEYNTPNLDIKDKNSLFFNKKVVVTGLFSSYSREDIHSFVHSKGGCKRDSVTSATDFVIVGHLDVGPSKMAKINTLISEGGKLKIIYEPELKKIIENNL